MAILYDKKSLLNNNNFLEAVDCLYNIPAEDVAERYAGLYTAHVKGGESEPTYFYSSSGRIEICGNHTDHNNGKVLAAAVSVDMLAAVTPTADRRIIVDSLGYPYVEVDIGDLRLKPEEEGTSTALVKGVCKGFIDRGYAIGGFRVTAVSDVFKGAGMSSSASYEVLIAEILSDLYNEDKVGAVEKAIISQYAENVYFGKPSGLMDQSAVAIGGVSYIDFEDTSNPKVEKLDWNFDDTSAFVVNCGGDHCDLTPQYSAIKSEMEKVAKIFGQYKLRFVEVGEFYSSLKELKEKVSGRAILRAMHYFEENERVEALREAIKDEDEDVAYAIITASGKSSYEKLQNVYPESDPSEPIPLALALCEAYDGVRAFRVHGGGFAGTILAFVDNYASDEFSAYMSDIFGKQNVHALKIRNVGACRVEL